MSETPETLRALVNQDATIERAEKCDRRAELEPMALAISRTLDEYLSRVHGIQTSHNHSGNFWRWLTENGVIPVDAGELAAHADAWDKREALLRLYRQDRDAAEAQVDRIANGIAVLGEKNAALRHVLKMLTFSPDGCPDTWPSPEAVAAALKEVKE